MDHIQKKSPRLSHAEVIIWNRTINEMLLIDVDIIYPKNNQRRPPKVYKERKKRQINYSRSPNNRLNLGASLNFGSPLPPTKNSPRGALNFASPPTRNGLRGALHFASPPNRNGLIGALNFKN